MRYFGKAHGGKTDTPRKNISEVLDLTVEDAIEFFADQKRLVKRLRVLIDVGLGYLRLGQSTSTLSGGEAQRLKLASFLDRPATEGKRLFLFDEPTTGLHLADIDLLYHTLRRLVQRGDGVVIVEHSPDLISRSDWIIDLGPGGGVHGGELLYSGPLEGFLDHGGRPHGRGAAAAPALGGRGGLKEGGPAATASEGCFPRPAVGPLFSRESRTLRPAAPGR